MREVRKVVNSINSIVNEIISAGDKCQENTQDGCDSDVVVEEGVVFFIVVTEGLFDESSLMNPPLSINH